MSSQQEKTPRREQNFSEESGKSDQTSMSEAANRADYSVRNLAIDDDDPVTSLRRWFSVNSVVSTSSSLAMLQQDAVFEDDTKYTLIGNGNTGSVFEIPGANKVVKKAITQGALEDNLWNEYYWGLMVHEKFSEAADALGFADIPRIPRYGEFYAKDAAFEDWWNTHEQKLPAGHTKPHTAVVVIERVLPLPKPIREALIDVYALNGKVAATAKASQGNKACIARLYLGRKRRSTGGPYLSLRNFGIHLDQAIQIFPAEINRFAEGMANALAIMHWVCKTDAFDVEFVLGSAPTSENFAQKSANTVNSMKMCSTGPEVSYKNFTKRTVHLWVIDFDKVSPLETSVEGMKGAARAAEENDPYFPKPGHDENSEEGALWALFCNQYIETSGRIFQWQESTDFLDLPAIFLKEWEAQRQVKLEKLRR